MNVDLDRLALQPGERWFVVHTLPHREAGAQAQLHNQGFRTFLPRIRKTRRHARRFEKVLVPLFPRYLFIILNLQRDRWRSVNGTYGVARLVMEAERPLPVPFGVVESFIALADAQGVVHFDRAQRLRPGQRVKVLQGSLADQIGWLEKLDERGRVYLLMELMGQQVHVKMPSSHVSPTRL